MSVIDPIAQAMAITHHALKDFFPTDFDKQCIYASFGIAAQLEDDGIAVAPLPRDVR